LLRVRRRVADTKLNRLVQAFVKAGIRSEAQFLRSPSGTPQGGVLSPLLANIALSAIDERNGTSGTRGTRGLATRRSARGRPSKLRDAAQVDAGGRNVADAAPTSQAGPVSILCGALNLQIEHHLCPRLPPNRLREIAPRVKAICDEHGVRYRTASWSRTLRDVLRSLVALSAPGASAEAAAA
jgi:hypothetical protein